MTETELRELNELLTTAARVISATHHTITFTYRN